MTRLVPLTARKVIRALERLGFVQDHQRGSHLHLKHPDGRIVTVPVHPGEDLRKGTLRAIIRDAGVSVEEFLEHT
ncbi:MAG: type II toxin-antitoxin system HicA family toxin [Euryarchaeota archaeon]|nr:type II toxin-antitoxin system HicA family toxin [Euryarchaeota archaeon]MDE1837218.1 type II toxin-antitoxin system HicA family toxin [Euryarchaeota archaeon]MDE1881416.1 type II toxin-antitoxin system HicA family toxin [Euryarchaeota archaeon]MDE2045374.1 type II toxin-antitoxin system HicA family toxin [Thermoplasmata archaeon]